MVFPVDVAMVNLLFHALFLMQDTKPNVSNILYFHSFMPNLNDCYAIEIFGESQVRRKALPHSG